MNLTRDNFRAIVFYDFCCHLSQKESCKRLRLAFHNEASPLVTSYNWFNEFKSGRTNLTDDREGRSAATTEDNISAVRLMIETNRRVTCQQIWTNLGIDMSQVYKILPEQLAVRKLCIRWILHNMTTIQKLCHVILCRDMMQRSVSGDSKAVYDIVTGDKNQNLLLRS
ncbi:Putative uncharacterized protein FLJ37770 [Eumeta japonica]|uniref:Mos1 transposase HTH domain-containing protein n=1 Tax=Eumeta variegata TaxID=151549 RepID=A0A4C1T701_EUMVA|nr:Putative uncharacterized protein FLJ37770 [Eumeta japonica]